MSPAVLLRAGDRNSAAGRREEMADPAAALPLLRIFNKQLKELARPKANFIR